MDKRPISKHPTENKLLNAAGFLKTHWHIYSKHTINISRCYIINPSGEISKHYKLDGYRCIGVP